MTGYLRNIQGYKVALQLIEISPDEIKLDPTNPRFGFSMRQLATAERTEAACTLLLTSQEETEALRLSIIRSNGVQEPIYLRSDLTVAEGNRRVVALRAAKEEFVGDARFATMPAWVIPPETPEYVVQDLLNEIHLGSVRGWAPYEKALQMQSLTAGGLIEEEVAERYRLTAREVRQYLAAVDYMNRLYFPIVADPTDPEHRAKFSYFLEFEKSGRLQAHANRQPLLEEHFARWVRDGRIDTGASVRRLARILDDKEATRLLDIVGFDAAEEYLAKVDPVEQELYAVVQSCKVQLSKMTVMQLMELRNCHERQELLTALQRELAVVLSTALSAAKVS